MRLEEVHEIFNACKDKNRCFVCGGALEEIEIELPTKHPQIVKRIPVLFTGDKRGKRCVQCGLLYAK